MFCLKFTLSDVTLFLPVNLLGLKKITYRPDAQSRYLSFPWVLMIQRTNFLKNLMIFCYLQKILEGCKSNFPEKFSKKAVLKGFTKFLIKKCAGVFFERFQHRCFPENFENFQKICCHRTLCAETIPVEEGDWYRYNLCYHPLIMPQKIADCALNDISLYNDLN